MTTGATGQLGLALPVQGELSGTWGDTVNNGITQYTNIAIAATLTLTNDGAVTLANTTGDASASNITSSLTGAGTVTAQFAIVKVTGTLTTTKVVTAPSYSKTYVVVNAATGGTVTFKASGQTGVSIAVGESAWVYYNGTDYVKIVGTATAGAAGGSNTQVQYNSSGSLAGSSNLTFDGTNLTLGGGTANGVTYLNGSKVLTSGSALVFDGTNLSVGTTALSSGKFSTLADLTAVNGLVVRDSATTYANNDNYVLLQNSTGATAGGLTHPAASSLGVWGNDDIRFLQSSSATEQMRLTSTGLGIGTSSPAAKLEISATTEQLRLTNSSNRVRFTTESDGTLTIGNTSFSLITLKQNIGGGVVYGGFQYVDTNRDFALGAASGKGVAILVNGASTASAYVDSSGNLGVGTTSPSTFGTFAVKTSLGSISIASGGSIGARLKFYDSSNTQTAEIINNGGSNELLQISATAATGSILFNTNSLERARIDSSGNLLVGTTTAAAKLTIASTTNPALTLPNIAEIATVSATAATGTINYDLTTQSVLYYTTNASGNFTMNIRGNSGLSLNSMMSTGQSVTMAFLCTNGATAYYQTAMTIDGTSVTPKWQGGTAPTTGNASAIDSYVYTIIKTASATFTVLASQTKFA